MAPPGENFLAATAGHCTAVILTRAGRKDVWGRAVPLNMASGHIGLALGHVRLRGNLRCLLADTAT